MHTDCRRIQLAIVPYRSVLCALRHDILDILASETLESRAALAVIGGVVIGVPMASFSAHRILALLMWQHLQCPVADVYIVTIMAHVLHHH